MNVSHNYGERKKPEKIQVTLERHKTEQQLQGAKKEVGSSVSKEVVVEGIVGVLITLMVGTMLIEIH